MMSVERFYTCVEECLGGGCLIGELAVDEARRTTHAVLSALGRRLDRAARLRLAAGLPRRLAVELAAASEPADKDLIGRVADELQLDEETAARRVCCVVATLREAVGEGTPLPADVLALAH